MLRHEGGAEPENVRILRARGDSMEPAIHDGDRLLVDTSRRTPATGEMAVLWDGGGLVVKRVEIIPRTQTTPDLGKPRLPALHMLRRPSTHGRNRPLGAQEGMSGVITSPTPWTRTKRPVRVWMPC